MEGGPVKGVLAWGPKGLELATYAFIYAFIHFLTLRRIVVPSCSGSSSPRTIKIFRNVGTTFPLTRCHMSESIETSNNFMRAMPLITK
jgi:hypothetical protein